MTYERHYGVEARVEYTDMTARLVVNDSPLHFDPERALTLCAGEACVAYHVHCYEHAGVERCLVVLERGRTGAINVEVTARGHELPVDWMGRLGVLPPGAAEPISFAQMRVSDVREWPREATAKRR